MRTYLCIPVYIYIPIHTYVYPDNSIHEERLLNVSKRWTILDKHITNG